MPGDELHQEAGTPADAASEAASGRSGPRHAAPKKPLLNRLHLPAGKAIAIAAMPSAVLMGMGLTPQLASAKGLPKSPYRPGPCVSQPDKEPDEGRTEKEKAREKAQKEKIEAAKKKAEEAKKKREADEADKDDSSGKGSGSSDADKPGPGSSPGGGDSDSGDSDSGSSDSGEKKNPLDPLGVGDAIDKAVGGDKSKDEDDKSKDDDKSADKSGSDGSRSDEPSSDGSGKDGGKDGSSGKDAGSAAGDAAGKVGDGVKDTTDKLGKGARDAAGKVGDGAKGGGKDGSSGTSDDKAGKSGAEGGKKAFPCPEEKKSEGKDEQTPVPLPDKPWRLEASSVALHKLDYKGVVNITASDGTKKQALKFTANSIDIGDLHQIVYGKDGTKYHVQAAKGSTSTFRGGQVTLYTEKLKGNLFGVVPIVFDPEHPPPVNVPEAVFTDVEITQAGQFGGNLTIPGLHQYVEQ